MAQEAHALHQVAARHAASSTAARSSRTTLWSCSRSRTSTARSSAAPLSTPRPSRRFAAPGRVIRPSRSSRSSSSTASGSRRRGRGTRSSSPTPRSSTRLWSRYPHTQLTASGGAVGLPDGQMGNSEVGHLTIGSGRILFQDLVRVTRPSRTARSSRTPRSRRVSPSTRARRASTCSASSPTAASTRTSATCWRSSARGRRGWGAHVDPCVHRRPRRLAALPPCRDLATLPAGADRDGRRPLLRDGPRQALGAHRPRASRRSSTASATHGGRCPSRRVRASYARRRHRRVRRAVHSRRDGRGSTPRDAAIFFNFRPDRGRQLSQRLLERRRRPDDDDPVRATTSTARSPSRSRTCRHARRGARAPRRAPAPRRRDREVRARHLLLQRRRRGAWPGETRILVPSPRDVASYDLKPEMSAAEVVADGVAASSATAIASASSTSPTPTWSGTPA